MNEITKIKSYLRNEQVRNTFMEVLGSNNTAAAYISSVIIAVGASEALQQCTPKSIAVSALRAATLGLSVDPALGKAYLVPFKNEATLVVGYKGLIDLATRTGKYRYINVAPVYEGEIVEEDRITGSIKLTNRQGGRAKGLKVIGYIAAFEMTNGYSKAIYMSIEDIHEHARRYSRIYSNPKSIWKTNPSVMERKTVLRALLQTWGYLNPTDVAVMEQVEIDAGERPQPNAMYELPDDDEVEIVEEQHQPASVEENLRMLGYDISEPTEVVSGRLI